MTRTALVTGGTGYIGGEVIAQLLDAGWRVHTTVRNVAKSEPRLRARWPDAGDRLAVFQADLLSDDGWAEANAGCDAVAHVASPFPLSVPKHADELVIPAREGTLRALRFAVDAGIDRFVQTSSAAAIAYGQPGKDRFDHTDWTDLTAGVPPYIESKTVAERAARDWVAVHKPDLTFCSINPVPVLGPVASGDLSTSVEMLKRLVDGAVPLIPNIGLSVVDVRDVAKMHVLAMQAPAETVRGERFPAAESFLWFADMVAIVRQETPEFADKLPTRRMPDWLVKLLRPFSADFKQLASELGARRDVSGQHAVDLLGMQYIPARQSIADTVRSLAAQGIVKS
ncbi:NAD-dependent epimerase/dehydratase family protein [Altererythrobacter sp. FM1]|uniref:NAD-dependent epimerase/dehydratase family protein n=1 Tax=Tsuneonella flava TaxID=2055955 RepID=UPI000C7FCE92|nr:NAD-dependent epimerase/dehydratase family protein [Tsuneonella flava]ROT95558.1 NAD-dependent epimerase/dehydratase family protein [Altererythrobacter sp. FM1]